MNMQKPFIRTEEDDHCEPPFVAEDEGGLCLC